MVEGPGHTMLVGTIEGLITFSSDFSDYENIRFYLNLPRPQAADGLCSADVMSVLRTTDETIYCYCYGGGLCKLVSSNLLSDELRFRSFGKETSPLARALIEDKIIIYGSARKRISLCLMCTIRLLSLLEKLFSIVLLIIVNVFRLQTGKGIS